jgi:hypothetical protein
LKTSTKKARRGANDNPAAGRSPIPDFGTETMKIIHETSPDALSLEDVLSRLSGARKCKSGFIARCPSHDDKRASLSIARGSDGKILLRCHAGCSFRSICEALGVRESELFAASPDSPPSAPAKRNAPSFKSLEAAVNHGTRALIRAGGVLANQWNYYKTDGSLVGAVVRVDMPGNAKEIRPFALKDNTWSCSAMDVPRPVYRLRELSAAKLKQLIVVCEGEKCCDAAVLLGFEATTSAGGAIAAGMTDWKIVSTFEDIWILADNDSPGLKYAEQVEVNIRRHNPDARIRMFTLPGVKVGGDLVDWLESLGDAAEPAGIRDDLRRLADASAVAASAGERDDDGLEPAGWVPFPSDALPDIARRFVEESAAALGCDASFVALPLLALAGASIGGRRLLEIKRGWRVPPILWAALVGRSGTNKTPAVASIMSLLAPKMRQWREDFSDAMARHEESGLQYDKRLKEWQKRRESNDVPTPRPAPPSQRRLIVSDATIEALAGILSENPRGLILVRDELDAWIQSFERYSGSSDAPFWLSAYSGASYSVDRRGRGAPTFLDQPLVGVVGGIQPKIWRSRMSGENQDSGMLARFIVSCPPTTIRKWRTEVVQASTRDDMAARLNEIVDISESPLGLSFEAAEMFAAWVDSNGAAIAEASDAEASCLTKIEELPARFANTLHALEGAQGSSVSGHTMESAIRLAIWCRHEKLRWHQSGADEPDDKSHRLVASLQVAGEAGMTPRQVARKCGWLRAPGAAEAALEKLARDGIAVALATTAAGGGRPRIVFRMNRL